MRDDECANETSYGPSGCSTTSAFLFLATRRLVEEDLRDER